jgi:aspartate/methionine/tyrosine aminotransferase
MISAPYMEWAKHRAPAAFDLAGSNLLGCSIDDIEGARDALSLDGTNPDGYPPLVEAIAAHYGVDASRVMTASGCSGANVLAMAATLSPGDRVLMERPFYDPLIGTARLMGAEVDYFQRSFDTGYRLDLDEMRSRMTSRTTLVVLTNPHNPSGVILDDESLRAAAAVAAEHGARLLVDEVYLDIANALGEGPRRTPAALLAPNAISTSSLTKSYGLNALRCGWAVAAPEVAERIRRARDIVDGIGPVPMDRLAVLAFAQIERLTERARTLVKGNLDTFRAWIANEPSLRLAAPAASSIAFPRVANSGETTALTERLQREQDVAVVPGRFFDEPRNIRISLAGRPEILRDGLERLSRVLNA